MHIYLLFFKDLLTAAHNYSSSRFGMIEGWCNNTLPTYPSPFMKKTVSAHNIQILREKGNLKSAMAAAMLNECVSAEGVREVNFVSRHVRMR